MPPSRLSCIRNGLWWARLSYDGCMAEPNDQRITSYERDGLVFDVVDSGPREGAPVVLLHGFPQRATAWEKVSDALVAAGRRTLAPDQRGYSPGARPRPVWAYRVPELVDDVVALIELLDTPVDLVGHDWGSVVAWAVAAEHPDKVRSLTAVSLGHPTAYARSLLTWDQGRRSTYIAVLSIPIVAESLLGSPGGWGQQLLRRSGMTPAMLDRYRREIVDAGALTGGLNWYRALPLSMTRMLPAVEVPTTLVWSTHDGALGRAQAERTADHVHAPYELVVLNGVTHWIPEEQPDELAQIILSRSHAPG